MEHVVESANNLNKPQLDISIGANDYNKILELTKPKNFVMKNSAENNPLIVDESDVSKATSKQVSNNYLPFGNQLELQSEAALTQQVKEALLGTETMKNSEYSALCAVILQGQVESYKKYDKNKQAQFLIKLYQDAQPLSEKVLDATLPFVGTLIISAALASCSLDYLNSNKKISLLKRLAPEQTKEADESIIKLLLVCNEQIFTNSSLETLLQLRQKTTLGDSYYQKLLQKNDGKLTKSDFAKLSKLSAKISTICYAYFVEETSKVVVELGKNDSFVDKKTFQNIKGLVPDERQKILSQLNKHQLTNNFNQVNHNFSEEKIKENIEEMMKDILKMKENFETTST